MTISVPVVFVDGNYLFASQLNINFSALSVAVDSGGDAMTGNLDMDGNQILNLRLEQLAADPTPATSGHVFYHTGLNLARIDDGTHVYPLLHFPSLEVFEGFRLDNDVTDPTNDITVDPGFVYSNNANIWDRLPIRLTSGLIKRLDAAWAVGTNQGMRASGAAIADTTYHLFAIYRPDTGVVDMAADTSATGANLAANTDAAYTHKRLLGSIMRESGAIVLFSQTGDEFMRTTASLDFTATDPGTAAVTRALKVPTGRAVVAILYLGLEGGGGDANGSALLTDLETADVLPDNQGPAHIAWAGGMAAARVWGEVRVRTNTSAQIRTRISPSSASIVLRGYTRGWIDRRGRDG